MIDFRRCPAGGHNYIGHVVDHFTKILLPLKTKSAQEVSTAIQEQDFANLGLPWIFHSDNGREFINDVLHRLFKDWGGDTILVNGRPRHSQSRGCVECGNRTIQNKIGKLAHLVGENPITQLMDDIAAYEEKCGSSYPWVSWFPQIMFALNMQKSDTTGSKRQHIPMWPYWCCEFIYLGFYVAFNTIQVISRWIVGGAEETSTYCSLGICTVNCRTTTSNYQLSHLRPCRELNPSLRGGR